MPNKERGGGGAQNRGEKKDHLERGDGRSGHDRDNDFNDPQNRQAHGQRKAESMPGGAGEKSRKSHANPPQDNTRPGGNRPKGSNAGSLDHD